MIYALLIGIDIYKNTSIQNLEGCKTDVLAFEACLLKQFKEEVCIKKLLDLNADRDNIIQTFRSHLAGDHIKPGDKAVFYFSGHGVEEYAPIEFVEAELEPSGSKIESLCCSDCDDDGSYDLADKELRILINEVAEKEAEVICIIDSCHSGSITRHMNRDSGNIRRKTSSRTGTRPIDTFLDGYYSKQLKKNGRILFPQPSYIAISACSHRELATEVVNKDGKMAGVFTTALVQVLSESVQWPSYNDLSLGVKTVVSSHLAIKNQMPQLACYGKVNSFQSFLGDQLNSSVPYPPLLKFEDGWGIPLGAVHGINSEITTNYTPQIFLDVDLGKAVGTAVVKEVLLDHSLLALEEGFMPREDERYCVMVNHFPLGIQLLGDKQKWVTIFNHSSFGKRLSVLGKAAYQLKETDQAFCIYNIQNGVPQLVYGIEKRIENADSHLMGVLEMISTWERLLHLAPPKNSLITPEEISFTIDLFYRSQHLGTHRIGSSNAFPESINQLDISIPNGPFDVSFQVRAHNHSEYPLYFYCVSLLPDYGIVQMNDDPKPIAAGGRQLLKDTRNTDEGFWLPDDIDEVADNFIFIAARKPIDFPYVFSQAGLGKRFRKISPIRGAEDAEDTIRSIKAGRTREQFKRQVFKWPNWQIHCLQIDLKR